MKTPRVVIASLLISALWLAPASAQEDSQEMVDLMNSYLTLADRVVDAAERPQAAIFMAIEGIYEIYEKRRDAPGAVRHLSKILDQHPNDRVVRNLVRLKLSDIYKETGEPDKALEQMDLIIVENAGQ